MEGNENLAIGILDSLSNSKNIGRIDVISSLRKSCIRYSNQINSYQYFNSASDHDYLNWIHKTQKLYQSDLLIPVFEKEMHLVTKYQQIIEQFIRIIPVPDYHQFKIALNKKSLAEFAVEHDLPMPKTISLKDYRLFNPDLKFPVMVKHEAQYGGSKVHKINGEPELNTLLSTCEDDDYIIQEYIEGIDFSCNVLYDHRKLVAHTIQKSIFREKEFTMSIAVAFLEDERLIQMVDEVMNKLAWNGIANIDVRYEPETDRYWLIEINPRFWGNHIASLISANVNFPLLLVHQAYNIFGTPGEKKAENFMFLTKYLKFRLKYLFNFPLNLSIYNTNYRHFLSDPWPQVYISFRHYYQLLRKLLHLKPQAPPELVPSRKCSDNNSVVHAP